MNMKKLSLIMFSSFYLIASSGMITCAHQIDKIFNQHSYSISLIENHINKSCCHQSEKEIKTPVKSGCPEGCCKDGVCSVKFKGEPNTLFSFFLKAFKLFTNSSDFINFQIALIENVVLIVPNYHSPPLIYQNPLYLQYNVFKI